MCRIVESLCCALEANDTLYVNYNLKNYENWELNKKKQRHNRVL